MSKEKYKQRIQDYIEDLIAEGANKDQVLNALTDVTLNYINAALNNYNIPRRRKLYSDGAHG
jgi:hypothetical protein